MIKASTGERIFNYFNILFIGLFSASILFPFICVINNSFRNNTDIAKNGFRLIPETIRLEAYKFLMTDSDRIVNGYRASIFITVVGTLLCLLFTSMMAYPFSRKDLPGRNVLLMMVVVTMFFSGGLIPFYLLISGLGMKDSWWALIIPNLITPWYMLILRNFFGEVPVSLIEAAKIEGASEATVLSRIILPLSLPSIACIGLFYAVGFWNSWFNAAIFLDTREKYPLQLVLRMIIKTANMEELSKRGYDISRIAVSEANVKAAAIIMTVAPILFIYPFLQKYFVKGMFLGSIKG